MQRLLHQDGELAGVISRQVDAARRTLDELLAQHLGERQPAANLLNPDEGNAFLDAMRAQTAQALEVQGQAIVREFSLDRADSALSRLVAELKAHHGDFERQIGDRVASVVDEFSLDRQDSALSRLVGRVESAQAQIGAQLSLDNPASGLNRLVERLERHHQPQTDRAREFETRVTALLERLVDAARRGAPLHRARQRVRAPGRRAAAGPCPERRRPVRRGRRRWRRGATLQGRRLCRDLGPGLGRGRRLHRRRSKGERRLLTEGHARRGRPRAPQPLGLGVPVRAFGANRAGRHCRAASLGPRHRRRLGRRRPGDRCPPEGRPAAGEGAGGARQPARRGRGGELVGDGRGDRGDPQADRRLRGDQDLGANGGRRRREDPQPCATDGRRDRQAPRRARRQPGPAARLRRRGLTPINSGMQLRDGLHLYSATDLVGFLECEHLTALDVLALRDPQAQARRVVPDESAELFARKGDEHERAYLTRLCAEGRSVVDVAADGGSIDDKVSRTLDAMCAGAEVIYQATLRDGALFGHADFLRRIDAEPSALGPWRYEVADTKLARSAKAKFLVQLAFYSHLLALAQGAEPRLMHVVLGDHTERAFRCADYMHYFRALLARFVERASGLANGAASRTYPLPCAHCDLCDWRERARRSGWPMTICARSRASRASSRASCKTRASTRWPGWRRCRPAPAWRGCTPTR